MKKFHESFTSGKKLFEYLFVHYQPDVAGEQEAFLLGRRGLAIFNHLVNLEDTSASSTIR